MKENINKNIFPFSFKLTTDVFTERQQDVLKLYIEGKNASEIALQLVIAQGTVNNHIYGLMIGQTNRTGLGIYGIIEKETGIRPYNCVHLINLLIENGFVKIIKTSENTKDLVQ